MPKVTCPSCGEKGAIPSNFIGTRIKCRKCGNAFLVGAPASKPAPSAAPAHAEEPMAAAAVRRGGDNEIQVEGLDDAAWSTAEVSHAEHDHEHEHGDAEHAHDEASSAFTAHGEAPSGGHKVYKLLTPKDRYFEGKFELDKLEAYLNILAKQGWVVRGMATPHVQIFGSEKEQLVILLER